MARFRSICIVLLSSEKQFRWKTRIAICLRDAELIPSALSSVSANFHEEDGRKDF